MTQPTPDKSPINLDTLEDVQESDTLDLSDQRIIAVSEALEQAQARGAVERYTNDLEPADWASLLEKIEDEKTVQLTALVADSIPHETFAYLGKDTAKLVLKNLEPKVIADIIADLDTDDAIDLLDPYGPIDRQEILRYVSRNIRALVEEGLTYPEDSVGRLMRRDFVAVPQFWTVGKTLDYLRGLGDALPSELNTVYITDPAHHVIGELPIVEFLRQDRKAKLDGIKQPSDHALSVTMDQEEAAYFFRRRNLSSVPVIDDDERMIGVVTLDDIADVIEEEAQEDIMRLAGVPDIDIYRGILGTIRSRFTWLALNLLTAILASVAIGFFEETLTQVVALAILMPIVASMGGNAGTQTLAVIVRAIATRELSDVNTYRVIGKEAFVGLVNGLGFAVIGGGVAYYWFDDPMIAVIIAVAMLFNLLIAGVCGVAIPIILNKMKIDPALASSVFLTTITDIAGFVLFLGMATIWLL